MGVVGLDWGFPAPAFAGSPWTVEAVLVAARSVENDVLAAVKSAWHTDASWDFYGDWCAWFVCWLLRNNGIPRHEYVPDLFKALPASMFHSVPLPGDIVFYGQHHVGLVTAVTNGVASTIEGNVGYSFGATTWANSWVMQFDHPWESSGITYARPSYSASTSENDMPYFSSKQNPNPIALNTAAWTRLTFNGTTDTDLAGGGAGYYDVTAHIYFSGVYTSDQVQARFIVQDVATSSESADYASTFNGNASGIIRVNHNSKISFPAGKRLFLDVFAPNAGSKVTVWGRQLLNWQA